MKQSLRKFLTFIFITTAIGYLINLAVDNPYTYKLIRTVINENVEKQTEFALNFQAISVRVFPPGVDLYGVKVWSQKEPETSLIESSHIRAKLSLWAALMGQMRLSLFEINELVLPRGLDTLIVKINTLIPPQPQKKPEPLLWPPNMILPVEHIRLINCNLDLPLASSDPNLPPVLLANIRGFNLDADFYNWLDWEFDTEIQSLDFHVQGKHLIQNGALKIKGELNRYKIKTKLLSLQSHDLNFTSRLDVDFDLEKTKKVRGPLLKFAQKEQILNGLEIHAAADVANSDMAVLGRYLGIDKTDGRVDGRVNVEVKIPFAADKKVHWAVAGQGKTVNAQLFGFKLHDSEASFAIDAQKIAFPKIQVIKDKKTYAMADGAILFDDPLHYQFKAAPDGLPLTMLLDTLTVKDFNAVDAMIFSKNLEITGTGFPFQLDVKADADFKELDFPILTTVKNRFAPPNCHLAVNLSVNADSIKFLKNSGTCNGEVATLHQSAALDTSAEGEKAREASSGSPIMIDGIAWFSKRGMDLNVSMPSFPASMASYYPQLSLGGTLSAHTKIYGPYDDLLVESNVNGEDIQLEKLPLGNIHSKTIVTVKNPQLLIPETTIQPNSGGTIRLQNSFISFNESLNSRLIGKIQNIQQSWIDGLFQTFIKGHSIRFAVRQGQFDVTGPLTSPLAYQGKLSLQLQDMTFDNQLIFTQLNTAIQSNENEFVTKKMRVAIDHFINEIDFSLIRKKTKKTIAASQQTLLEKLGGNKDDTFRLRIKTRRDESDRSKADASTEPFHDDLENLPFVGPYLKMAKLEGELAVKATLEGTFNKIEGNYDIQLNHPRFIGSPIGSLRAKGFLNGAKIDIPILTYSGDAMIGRLNIDLDAPGVPYEWYFHFNRMDLRAFGGPVFWEDPRNFAYFTANWAMRGKFARFWESKGELNIEDIQVTYVRDGTSRIEKFEVQSASPVTVLFDEKGWYFKDHCDLFLKGRDLNIHLALPDNRPPKATHIVAEGDLDISVLKRLVPAIESAKGRVIFNLAVDGDITDPKLLFSLNDQKMEKSNLSNWEPVTIGVADLSPAFTNIRMAIRFADGRLEIKELSAEKGKEGRISATGSLDFASQDPHASKVIISLRQAEIKRFPIAVLKSIDVVASGDLSLSGNQLPLSLAGNISIDKASSQGNFDIRNQILEMIRKRRFNAPSAPENPVLSLDLHVNAENSIYIKNRNIIATLSGNLNISGNEQAPILLGQIQIPKGQFSYKRVFDIQRGTITFDEPISPPDPKLDIFGIANVSSYRVMVAVTGQVSDPKVALAIDPPTRQDGTPIEKMDILLLLTSGHLPDQERSLGTSQNAARAASSEALNLVIGQFEEPIEKIFDMSGQTVIRQVYLDTYPSETDGRPVARLNLPINLTEDLNFILQVDDDSNMKISSEYSLHEGISISGSFDKKKEDGTTTKDKQPLPADTGVDLKFRFSFP